MARQSDTGRKKAKDGESRVQVMLSDFYGQMQKNYVELQLKLIHVQAHNYAFFYSYLEICMVQCEIFNNNNGKSHNL